jgi:hypothetical protein
LRKHFIILLFCCLSCFTPDIKAQSDSTRHSENIYGNYYASWHQNIKDTSHRTVSNFGHYVSIGIGGGSSYGIGGASALFSYSLAYKSHLFTLTRGGSSTLINGGSYNSVYYNANYFGFLYGESIRFKHAMISLSIGIASSNVTLRYLDVNAGSANTYVNPSFTNIVSFPIELKVFVYARNGIGFVIHSSKCLLSPSQFSPFYFGVCVVFGFWNKPKK